MRINFDRLSQLAGLPSSSNSARQGLYEGSRGDKKISHEGRGKKHEMADEAMEEGEGHHKMHAYEGTALDGVELSEDDSFAPMEEETDEMAGMSMDEMIEIDEVMLVQELRRAKKIMQENKRRRLNESRRQNMFEAQLKQIIDEEVQNVMDEMNLTSQWVYGDRKPRNSRKGYTNQGNMMPGIGFRR